VPYRINFCISLLFRSIAAAKMRDQSDSDQEPLLSRSATASPSSSSYSSISKSPSTLEEHQPDVDLDRSLEHDVIPETAVLGRNLGWSSAYILIISRVIGSGIFATPGTIVKSVGSIGLSLTLWIMGALVSWFGLAVSLEYGCMLPRSGGQYSGMYVFQISLLTRGRREGLS
jgi:hypothetical protein